MSDPIEPQETQELDSVSNDIPNQGERQFDGNSTEDLPDVYKPYKDVLPWESIPVEARDQALEGIKKYHGNVTRAQQEASELRQQVPELQDKLNYLENMYRQPEFQKALQIAQNGGQTDNAEKASSDLEKLSDYGIDSEVGKILGNVMRGELQKAMAPLDNQVKFLQQQAADKDARSQLSDVTKEATSKGLPDPNSKLSQIRDIITDRRASNVRDAYYLSINDQLPQIYTDKAKTEYQSAMDKKAEKTPPPGYGPSISPSQRDFTGVDAIERALKASENELGYKK